MCLNKLQGIFKQFTNILQKDDRVKHVATPRLVFNVFTRKFLYGTPDGMTRRNTNFGGLTQVTLASVDILYAVSTTEINIKQCGYYLVPLVAIISLAARSKCLVDDFA